ncbi:hypothetical protein SAMN05216522_101459 [Rosenbergiella nectarea]|uniref:Uncharacterized protein n=1 Tax=Rosenbergiella nectarea TaxID=988801 RepID=A0A1H9DYW6_9GAMM|nr:hypothetical protein SAMN05216522_101459 [Rosenbergiella nectarea]
MKIYKLLLFFFFTLMSSLTHAKSVSHFEGKKFKATIEYDCNEGNLTCNNVHLNSINIINNSTISLDGETINTNCPDICNFQGYQFKNGKYNYAFYPSLKGNGLWDYVVTLNDKVIANDLGIMK